MFLLCILYRKTVVHSEPMVVEKELLTSKRHVSYLTTHQCSNDKKRLYHIAVKVYEYFGVLTCC
jgi:hypothetical protein